MLWDYCEELRRSNSGSTVLMKVQSFNEDEMEAEDVSQIRDPVFQRLYVCFEACKTRFKNVCRPFIGLDACHLKGPYGGQLIAAVGRDPNEEYFPLAFAVVEAETYDSWTWFLKLLDADVGENKIMTYMSNQQKGLVQCFDAFPNQEHRSCCRHIYNNLKRRHPGILIKELFWRAAQATYIQEFEKVMSELKEVDVGAHKWLEELPLKTWTRSKFTGNAKSDALLNNMCECFNSKIIEARQKPIISLVEDIRLYLMRSHAITCIHYNKEKVDNYVDDCYKVPTYKTCYKRMILPINGSTMWAKTRLPPMKPPHLRRPPGRPKKNSVREPDESKAGTKLGRIGTAKKCKKCGKLGHNKRSCKGEVGGNSKLPQATGEKRKMSMGRKGSVGGSMAAVAALAASSMAAATPSAAAASLTSSASVSRTPGAAASSSNTKAQKKQKNGTFTIVTVETLRASKNASRYMSAFKVVGSQESVHGPIAKQ
uniref:CCHC-type domain-containing protein n=1 Tax=Fagus sylvatica TaxID=28930 RepID=A0A2N9HNE0_FAGSY